jgi:hypothetical protein
MTDGNFTQHPGFNFHPLTEKTFGCKKYLNMYKDIYLNLVNLSIIDPYIDSIINMIRTDVDWDAALPKIGRPLVQQLPGSNITVEDANKFFLESTPPGFRFLDITEPYNVTFEVAVNGSSPVNTSYNVKESITKTYSQISNFYDQA